MNVSQFNQHQLNQQSQEILAQNKIHFNQETELAALVLVRMALESNLLETEIEEPLLLIAKLSALPELAMSLMTESEPGIKYEVDLSEGVSLGEAAAMILEEIVASLEAIAS
jgi:malonyl CoA-acyl carrier protein transacylase